MKRITEEKIIFISIVFVAAVLRLWNYWNWSFTHDELGAIVRLDYSSFRELIREGVQNNDTHPAFTQVFLYLWTSLFGLSEASVRLPFVIAGIGSVVLNYLIAKKWFGAAAASFSSLALAILDFPILYSQLARPYSFGLFFSLLAVWLWTKLLFGILMPNSFAKTPDVSNLLRPRQVGAGIYKGWFCKFIKCRDNNNKNYLKAIGYGIATAICMLTHYFSFFFAMMLAASGFFFLKKKTWKPYLLAGAVAFILFLPHIRVSLHQFSRGGVGEWLAPPGHDFFKNFILYIFNDSSVVLISIAVLFVLSILIYHLEISLSRIHLLCIIWFLLPFIAGYYYSESINPVLQYSVLLFSFPFLPLFLFSFFREKYKILNRILLIVLGLVLFYSTLIEQRFYQREYFAVYKEIDLAVLNLHEKYGEEKITTVLNTSDKKKFDFYFKRWNVSAKFDFYAGDDSAFVANMLRKINSCSTPYFLYGWSNFRSPYEIYELLKRDFPCVLYEEKHFNSQITLFGKNDSCFRDTVFYSSVGFEISETEKDEFRKFYSYDEKKTDTLSFYEGEHSLKIEPKNEFCITLKTSVKKLFRNSGQFGGCVNISAWIYPSADGKFNAQMVMEVGEPNTKKDWFARVLPQFVKPTGEFSSANLGIVSHSSLLGEKNGWHEVFATFELPSSAYPDDEVVIYLWNPGKNSFYLDNFTVSSFADSRYDYYAPSFRK